MLLGGCAVRQPDAAPSPDADSAGQATTAVAPEVTVVSPDAEAASASGTDSPGAEAPGTATSEEASSASADPAGIEFVAGDTLALEVDGGEFESVELVDLDHDRVAPDAGSVAAGGTHWQASAGLAGGAAYEWRARTVSTDGQRHETSGTIETASATGSPLRARSVIADDETVGVAAPIIINFAGTVTEEYRDDVEHRLSVEVTDEDGSLREVDGGWAWLPDIAGHSRVHYRPKEFWPAHSQISVDLPFEGVRFSDSSHGGRDMTLDFEIGREQLVEADAESHRMVVTRDGEEIWDFPASLGMPRAPSFNGTHIVMSKAESYTMTSETWGYSTPVNWAVRIHNNGEFIHAAPWSVSAQGARNVSHGCINLSTERAREYYESALYGDPVEITGSSVSLTPESGDVSDWVYEWDEWQDLSAL
nr:Ig-like domain-containing protein [Brevibacterium daeguense]